MWFNSLHKIPNEFSYYVFVEDVSSNNVQEQVETLANETATSTVQEAQVNIQGKQILYSANN